VSVSRKKKEPRSVVAARSGDLPTQAVTPKSRIVARV
jgi:hypothetical protein